jgi:ParB family chromosome partitioning protein
MISGRKGRRVGVRKPESDPDLRAVEEELVKALGTKVAIVGNRKKGTIKISYFSLDDLNRIYGKIKGGSR